MPDGAATAVLQQVAINGNHVVALGQATPAAGTAAGTDGAGTVPFAELSAGRRRDLAAGAVQLAGTWTPPSPR